MNSNITRFPGSPVAPKTSRGRLVGPSIATVIGLALAVVNTTYGQVSTINSVIMQPRALNSLTNAVLAAVTNYPVLISFTETNAGTTNTAFSPNQDFWQFSVKGKTNAYLFQSNDFFTASMTVTLTGAPLSPRKEAGFAFNDVAGNINGQFILDLDAGEVVAFGGNLPFYASPLDHFYLSGEPITMGITILTDANGVQSIIYSADGFSSAPFGVWQSPNKLHPGRVFSDSRAGHGSDQLRLGGLRQYKHYTSGHRLGHRGWRDEFGYCRPHLSSRGLLACCRLELCLTIRHQYHFHELDGGHQWDAHYRCRVAGHLARLFFSPSSAP